MTTKMAISVALIYGAVLAVCSFVAAGFGHGTYTLLGLAGSPFAVLGIPAAFLAACFQWCGLVLARSWIGHRYLAAILIVHYAAGALLLTVSASPYADWSYVGKLPQSARVILVFGFLCYGVGQIALWRTLLKQKI